MCVCVCVCVCVCACVCACVCVYVCVCLQYKLHTQMIYSVFQFSLINFVATFTKMFINLFGTQKRKAAHLVFVLPYMDKMAKSVAKTRILTGIFYEALTIGFVDLYTQHQN